MKIRVWLWRRLPTQFRYRLYHRIIGWATAVHVRVLEWVWCHGALIRRWRAPHPVDRSRRVIVHATTSFDVGGTQTQIKHLCTSATARYEHQSAEVFPELNYLYKQGETLDPARYARGGPIGRLLGRWVLVRNYRSTQLLQIYKLARDFEAAGAEVAVGWGHEICATTFIAAALARVPKVVFCIRTVNPRYGWVDKDFAATLLRAHQHLRPLLSATAVNSTLLQGDHAAWVGMDPATIAVCANGIDIAPIDPAATREARARIRAERGISEDAVVIINVGRFSAEKGQRTLIEANRLLLARGTTRPVVWLLCGDGITLPDVQRQADGYGMTNVHFVGRTSQVRDMLGAADIFVMPSDFEGMPNAMMEAMAAGLPCVSTRVSGARDVAREDVEALYYDARDYVQLARHLARLVDDPAEARRLGESAAIRIKEFSVPRFVNCFESVLDRIREL